MSFPTSFSMLHVRVSTLAQQFIIKTDVIEVVLIMTQADMYN